MDNLQNFSANRWWNASLIALATLAMYQNVVAEIIIDESTIFESTQRIRETIQTKIRCQVPFCKACRPNSTRHLYSSETAFIHKNRQRQADSVNLACPGLGRLEFAPKIGASGIVLNLPAQESQATASQCGLAGNHYQSCWTEQGVSLFRPVFAASK